MQNLTPYYLLFVAWLFLVPMSVFAQKSSDSYTPMPGFVDMHTHPRSDLAFGTNLYYGAPYGNMAVELKDCKADHGKNFFRTKIAAQTETQYNAKWIDGKEGYPDFKTWPAWCSVLHQQMWVDWIERAHSGGLNIMVALATSSHCIAAAAKTKDPYDDETAILSALQGIKDMVVHSTFMEIAMTPQDARRIVASGKLAVILGIEIDNIGNFYSPADHYRKATFNASPTNEQIQVELDKLWWLGVRYIFPVHITNNVFGGAALYLSTFDAANKFNTGTEYIPENISTKESGIAFHLQHPILSLNTIAKLAMPLLVPRKVNPARKKNYTFWEIHPGYGHRNSLGMTDRGRFAVSYMMRKGFIIDIDHMSEKMATEALDTALKYDYPLNSGHTNPRGAAGDENGRTLKQYAQLKQLGGMVGVGHGDHATDFVKTYRQVLRIMKFTNVAIGTDVNGFYPLPQPDRTVHVAYDSSLVRCTAGNRTWDINTDGFAHYGLFPDWIKSCEAAGMTLKERQAFMSSAENFTQMWEKCEMRKSAVAK